MSTSTTNGMIEEPSKDDVICGRGGKSNHHPGNIAFRAIIADHHTEYLDCNRSKKTMMTVELLRGFRAAGVRFLRHVDTTINHHGGQCYWLDVGDQLARTKISQALRDSTTTSTVPTPAVTTSDEDDQPVTVDTKREKRKPASPGCTETSRNPKRVLHDTIFHELPTPAITTAPAATTSSSLTTQVREVSPVPSRTGTATITTTGDGLFVPSLEVSGPSLQQPHRYDGEQDHDFPVRTPTSSEIGEELRGLYHVSPTEATLFEQLEHEDNDKFCRIAVSSAAVSRWSVGGGGCTRLLLDRHNPFVLPDLPSRDDAPLRLPSIGVKIWDDDVCNNNDQCRLPREVSPIAFDAIPSLQQVLADINNGSRRRKSWTPATFALLNDDFSDVTPFRDRDDDDDSDFLLGPHVVKSDSNHPVLSPSRHPKPCFNDDEDGDGWTCSITFHHDDDDNDDLDDGNTPTTTTTTTSTFARATFSAFRPFTTSTNAGN